MPLLGLQSSSLSISIVNHQNLLSNVTGFVKVIVVGEVAELKQKIDKLNLEIQNLRNELNESKRELQKECQKSSEERSALQEKIRLLESQIRAKETQISELEKIVEILEATKKPIALPPHLLPYTIDELVMYAKYPCQLFCYH